MLQATRLFLNEQPLYLGTLLYFVHPEPDAFWQCLSRCFPYNLALYILQINAQQQPCRTILTTDLYQISITAA